MEASAPVPPSPIPLHARTISCPHTKNYEEHAGFSKPPAYGYRTTESFIYEVFDKDYRMGAYNNVACQQHYIINYIAMFIPCAGYIDKAWSFIMS